MNRIGAVLGIMAVVLAGAGGGAYWWTAEHPTPKFVPPPPPTVAPGQFSAAMEAEPASATPSAPDLARAAAAEEPLTIANTLGTFDYKSQHLVFVLPPGITPKGPYSAEVTIKGDGKVEYEKSIALKADFPVPGSKPQYPRSARIVRLSADQTWPTHYAAITGAVDGVKTKYGPGKGELTVFADVKTEIDADWKDTYCTGDDSLPDIRVFLEKGEPAQLYRVDISGSEDILKTAMLSGCKKG